MRRKLIELIPIEEAMDNLATIVSINMQSPPPIGIVKGSKIVIEAEAAEFNDIRWLAGEGPDSLLQVLDDTYHSVYHHLKNIYDNPAIDWTGAKSRDGIAAMMSLVGESAPKMSAYLAFRLDKPLDQKVEERESFVSLQRFFSDTFSKKIVGGIEGKDVWEKQFHESHSLLMASGSDLKDFESLLRDKEYELFYITNEDGVPYLGRKLLRNLKLTVDFDTGSASFEEDPFLKVKSILDRDLQASASQIVHACQSEMESFFKLSKEGLQSSFGSSLSKAAIALLLAANPRHLLQRTVGKSCSDYFGDFHRFLRLSLKSFEYQRWIGFSAAELNQEKDRMLDFVHKLCFAFFSRSSGVKQEAIGLIHRSMRRGEELQSKECLRRAENIWDQLLLEDEKLRALLRQFPSGPLLKILDTIRHDEDGGVIIPFDPLIQGNLPFLLYSLRNGKKKVDVLSFAAPVCQQAINQVEIVDEFRGFLRYMTSQGKGKKHLLVHLEDRLSWRESTRSQKLEQMEKNEHFSSSLMVMTLPKNTEFYHQKNRYREENSAVLFMKEFKLQLENPEQNGFYFPKAWMKEDLLHFAEQTFSWIHKHVFESKKDLSLQMREDFIELFYQMLVVEAIERFEVDSLSFTCKDSVDTGAYASAMFYGFLKEIKGGLLEKENLDFVRYLFYWRALSVRERAADPEMFHRALSCLQVWHHAVSRGEMKHSSIEWSV
jgi:hypothetical protein